MDMKIYKKNTSEISIKDILSTFIKNDFFTLLCNISKFLQKRMFLHEVNSKIKFTNADVCKSSWKQINEMEDNSIEIKQ